MRTTIVEVFAVAKCAAHPAEFCGFFEQSERYSRSLRVERNPHARGSSPENRQIDHRNLVRYGR
jgi:proteasome lid subunit RPN8/RPN11